MSRAAQERAIRPESGAFPNKSAKNGDFRADAIDRTAAKIKDHEPGRVCVCSQRESCDAFDNAGQVPGAEY